MLQKLNGIGTFSGASRTGCKYTTTDFRPLLSEMPPAVEALNGSRAVRRPDWAAPFFSHVRVAVDAPPP